MKDIFSEYGYRFSPRLSLVYLGLNMGHGIGLSSTLKQHGKFSISVSDISFYTARITLISRFAARKQRWFYFISPCVRNLEGVMNSCVLQPRIWITLVGRPSISNQLSLPWTSQAPGGAQGSPLFCSVLQEFSLTCFVLHSLASSLQQVRLGDLMVWFLLDCDNADLQSSHSVLRVYNSMCISLSVCTSYNLFIFPIVLLFTSLSPWVSAFPPIVITAAAWKYGMWLTSLVPKISVFSLLFCAFSAGAFCLLKCFNHLLEDRIAFLGNHHCISGFLSDRVKFTLSELFRSCVRGNVCNWRFCE